jgi:hypothetical protein
MFQFNIKRLVNAHPLLSTQLGTVDDIPEDDASTIKGHRASSIDVFIFDNLNFSEEHPPELPARPSSSWPGGDHILDLLSFPGYIPLVTENIDYIYHPMEYSNWQTAHLVIKPIGSLEAMIGVGMKIETRGVKGKLVKVHSLVDEGVRFMCQQDNGNPFVLLQVEYEYAKLPFLWRMKLFGHWVQQKGKKWCRKL